MTPETIRKRLVVSGRVQGVFYRDSTREAAENHGVAGWAKNRDDGAVEIVLEGPPEAVEAVVGFCRLGPVSAEIDAVDERDETPEGLAGFEIR
jgi:acylphosphatase